MLDAFRQIYHQSPTASKAPAAVAAVADLLAEKGRVLGDAKALRDAIGQYEYLRQQYPDSPAAENALLLEAEICRQDLKDAPCAEEKLHAVIAAAPDTSFAEQAAMELKQIASAAPKIASGAAKNARATVSPSSPQPSPQKPVAITGMRHWSNPTSTRIAIDLGGKVEYEAARVPGPDRIFFDLHGARLAPSLNGRQVEVIDDGYLKRIRAAQFHPDVTRVVLDVTDVSQYSAFMLPNPWRLIIDIHGNGKINGPRDKGTDKHNSTPSPNNELTWNEESAARQSKVTAADDPSLKANAAEDNTFSDLAKLGSEPAKIEATAGPTSGPVSASVAQTPASSQTHASLKSKSNKGKSTAPAISNAIPPELPHAADPTADGQRSLVRALGLKVGRIVIDAGHGGHDSGTLGPGGIEEKDVTLDVALRVGKLLHRQVGAEIVYTRDDDTFVPLETRTAIANKAQADLFLSIHCNSSPEPEARGVETYYLNFTSDPEALDVAARENAVSSQSVHQLSDLVRKIALKDKIDESRELATDVDQGLYSGLKSGNPGLRDRGVKKAPFVVLIGAQMPSILAEISFLTNPDDAQQLREPKYRQRIAEAIVAGAERYMSGLSGTRPTTKEPERNPKRTATRDPIESLGARAGN